MRSHRWDVSIKEATEIQKTLRDSIVLAPLEREPAKVAGADVSFGRFSNHFFACIVVLAYPSMEILETSYFDTRVSFPYVPGYLSFREVPAIAEAYKRLREKPDVIMMDGHGIAHPRRLGVASHLGLVLDTPVFGCAKSRLYGVGEIPDTEKGSTSPLLDPATRETIGTYVRTKRDVSPVIVSPGHRITLDESVSITLSSIRTHRIPEPTRLAHELVNAYRREKTGA